MAPILDYVGRINFVWFFIWCVWIAWGISLIVGV